MWRGDRQACSEEEALERAIRLHLAARYLTTLAEASSDLALLGLANSMALRAEILADIGLGHYSD